MDGSLFHTSVTVIAHNDFVSTLRHGEQHILCDPLHHLLTHFNPASHKIFRTGKPEIAVSFFHPNTVHRIVHTLYRQHILIDLLTDFIKAIEYIYY